METYQPSNNLKLIFVFSFLLLIVFGFYYGNSISFRSHKGTRNTQTLAVCGLASKENVMTNSTRYPVRERHNFTEDETEKNRSFNATKNKPQLLSIESSVLLQLVANVSIEGPCSAPSSDDVTLQLDGVDCALFCLGRSFPFFSHNSINNSCFCSRQTPETNTSCSNTNKYVSYRLSPVVFPQIKVRRESETN